MEKRRKTFHISFTLAVFSLIDTTLKAPKMFLASTRKMAWA